MDGRLPHYIRTLDKYYAFLHLVINIRLKELRRFVLLILRSQASIGFSIPITNMFAGSIIWKGILYSLLMIVAKGLVSSVIYFEYFVRLLRTMKVTILRRRAKVIHRHHPGENTSSSVQVQAISVPQPQVPNERTIAKPPHSIALLVGFAMIARGEIGFLIGSLSQSSGTLTLQLPDRSDDSVSGEEIFLVVVWAVVLCTITGPIGVGIMVRRLKQQNTLMTW